MRPIFTVELSKLQKAIRTRDIAEVSRFNKVQATGIPREDTRERRCGQNGLFPDVME